MKYVVTINQIIRIPLKTISRSQKKGVKNVLIEEPSYLKNHFIEKTLKVELEKAIKKGNPTQGLTGSRRGYFELQMKQTLGRLEQLFFPSSSHKNKEEFKKDLALLLFEKSVDFFHRRYEKVKDKYKQEAFASGFQERLQLEIQLEVCCKLVKEQGVSLNQIDYNQSLLCKLVDSIEAMKSAMKNGADINFTSKDNVTPLMIVCERYLSGKSSLEEVEYVAKHMSLQKINVQDDYGHNAVHWITNSLIGQREKIESGESKISAAMGMNLIDVLDKAGFKLEQSTPNDMLDWMMEYYDKVHYFKDINGDNKQLIAPKLKAIYKELLEFQMEKLESKFLASEKLQSEGEPPSSNHDQKYRRLWVDQKRADFKKYKEQLHQEAEDFAQWTKEQVASSSASSGGAPPEKLSDILNQMISHTMEVGPDDSVLGDLISQKPQGQEPILELSGNIDRLRLLKEERSEHFYPSAKKGDSHQEDTEDLGDLQEAPKASSHRILGRS